MEDDVIFHIVVGKPDCGQAEHLRLISRPTLSWEDYCELEPDTFDPRYMKNYPHGTTQWDQMRRIFLRVRKEVALATKVKDDRPIMIPYEYLMLSPQLQIELVRWLGQESIAGEYGYALEARSMVAIGEIGMAVARRLIDPLQVSIWVFSRDEEKNVVKDMAAFDTEGVLHNWPPGIFEL